MRFNLADYETVEERLRRAHAMYEDLRVVTEWENNYRYTIEENIPAPNTWVIKASIYLTAGDQANNLPKATGYAFEIDGTGGANNGPSILGDLPVKSVSIFKIGSLTALPIQFNCCFMASRTVVSSSITPSCRTDPSEQFHGKPLSS